MDDLNDPKAMVEQYTSTIDIYARYASRGICSSMLYDDLRQEGFFVLLRILDGKVGSYQKSNASKASFRTFLIRCLLNHYRSMAQKLKRQKITLSEELDPEAPKETPIDTEHEDLRSYFELWSELSPVARLILDFKEGRISEDEILKRGK